MGDAKPPQDLKGVDGRGAIDWNQGDPAGSLEAAAERVFFTPMNQAIEWYFKNKKSKKLAGQSLRVLAWALGGVAALTPVVSQMFDAKGEWLKPGYTTLALLLAAGLVWLDRFFGLTSGWMRYISAGQELLELRDRLSIDWALAKSAWGADGPTPEQVVSAMKLLQGMNGQVHSIVRTETSQWMSEFRDTLKTLEQTIDARHMESVQPPGAINVVIENDKTLMPGWTLRVNDRDADPPRDGRTAAIDGLPPGRYWIRAAGTEKSEKTIDGKSQESLRPVAAERVVTVESGKIADVTLRLS